MPPRSLKISWRPFACAFRRLGSACKPTREEKDGKRRFSSRQRRLKTAAMLTSEVALCGSVRFFWTAMIVSPQCFKAKAKDSPEFENADASVI
jgi:hypothetical protein